MLEGTPDDPNRRANDLSGVQAIHRDHNIQRHRRIHIFTPKGGIDINISGLRMMLPHGSYENILSGLITVTSNETVIVGGISDINHFLEGSTVYTRAGLRSFATYLLSANRLEVTYPPPKPSEAEAGPAGGLGVDMTLVAVLVAVAVVAVGIFLVLKKRKP